MFEPPPRHITENQVTVHPLQNRTKDIYAGKIKYAHNSANNPTYPRVKEKKPHHERYKFTIFGNRVTREFNYCVQLAKGLHKYKWRSFDTPIIKGCTGIEWPQVWNTLKLQYGGISFCLQGQVAILINNQFLGGEEELRELIETKYVYHLILDYYKLAIDQFTGFVKISSRPCAYMHISIDNKYVGTLIFMLYADIVPLTCENFLRLCRDTKGGYSGTPIHRIVKECWIQCGGFGLKSTDMDCENYIVPHDRRGVLGMANDGRNVDCSTQFFVLLEPAPWMDKKYVAFGQLIDGDETLKQIENVPTYYESPKTYVQIDMAGLLNLDCQDIVINKGANEYIHGHIDNLVAVGEFFIGILMDNVFLELQLKLLQSLEVQGEGGEGAEGEEMSKNLHATKRFLRNKDDIQKQLEKSQVSKSSYSDGSENRDFAVEEYEYEPEESTYKHESETITEITVEKPERPYYIPLTDVPYPGEVDSTYDLKKFLRGDYCLESDLAKIEKSKPARAKRMSSYISNIFIVEDSPVDTLSLDSEEEREIQRYIKFNVDRLSFAGGIVKNIAKKGIPKTNLLEDNRLELTDDDLRRLRLSLMNLEHEQHKKVSISAPTGQRTPKIKRRQTGYVRPEDLENVHVTKSTSMMFDSDQDDDEIFAKGKVRIDPTTKETTQSVRRRPTGFNKSSAAADNSDAEVARQSVLARLYDDVAYTNADNEEPTLKNYKPIGETHLKSLLLTNTTLLKSGDDGREKYRRSMTYDEPSTEQALNMQHGRRFTRKISSDYVKTMDQAQRNENSIRSLEFAKKRPSMSVAQYQKKNLMYQQESKTKSDGAGLRLPGDTPIYSPTSD